MSSPRSSIAVAPGSAVQRSYDAIPAVFGNVDIAKWVKHCIDELATHAKGRLTTIADLRRAACARWNLPAEANDLRSLLECFTHLERELARRS